MFKYFMMGILLGCITAQLADVHPLRQIIINKTGKTPYEHGENAGKFIRGLFVSQK